VVRYYRAERQAPAAEARVMSLTGPDIA
jgi:hypothetical protein